MASGGRKGFKIVTRVAALAAMGAILWFLFHQPPPPAEVVPYVGDPLSGCAYPVSALDKDKLAWATGTYEKREQYDHLDSLQEAIKAGYRPCPY